MGLCRVPPDNRRRRTVRAPSHAMHVVAIAALGVTMLSFCVFDVFDVLLIFIKTMQHTCRVLLCAEKKVDPASEA